MPKTALPPFAGRLAISYLRFSHPSQALGDSQRRQIEASEAWCQKNGAILSKDIVSDLGMSGWKGRHSAIGALSRFLHAVKKGQIPKGTILLLEKLDRLTRQRAGDATELFLGILRSGITIVTIEPEYVYTPERRHQIIDLMMAVFSFVANNEKSETLSKRLRETWAQKRLDRKPLTAWCPAWVRLNEDRTAYVLIPEKAAIVKRIVGMAMGGRGAVRIAQRLHRGQVPVISDNETWSESYITKILKSESLTGRYRPGTQDWVAQGKGDEKIEVKRRRVLDEVWEDYLPRLISDDDWDKLQARRKSRSKGKGNVGKCEAVGNLFSGLLVNARDGQQIMRVVKDVPRLISMGYKNGIPGADTMTVPYLPFEICLLHCLRSDLKPAELFGTTEDQPEDKVSSLTAKLSDLDARIAAMESRMDSVDPDELPTLSKKVAQWRRERKEVVAELQAKRADHSSRGGEAEMLGDVQAVLLMLVQSAGGDSAKLLDHGYDVADLRTQAKARLRSLIETIHVLTIGEKRSKWKSSIIQIDFRAGGRKWVFLLSDREEIVSGRWLESSQIRPGLDLRLLHDQQLGQPTRDFVAFMEGHHAETVARARKYPPKRVA